MTTCRLLDSFQLPGQFMSSRVDISISLLPRKLSYIKRTNTDKNQIIPNMLSASKLSTKAVSQRYVCISRFSASIKGILTKILPFDREFNFIQAFFSTLFFYSPTFVANSRTEKKGTFYVTALRAQKSF
jgi:hypothetical protein